MSYVYSYFNVGREQLYSISFFAMGCLWFLVPVYENMSKINAGVMIFIALVYISQNYKQRTKGIKINRDLYILTAFVIVWLVHTCLTGLTSGHVPNVYYENGSARSGFRYLVHNRIYDPLGATIYWLIKNIAYIFLYYIVVSVLKRDRKRNLIRWFARGTLFMMPLILVFMFSNSRFISVARLGPTRPDGSHVHPNTVGLVFMFTFYVNLLSVFLEKRRILKTGHILSCIVSVLFIIMSGSRSCALSLFVAMSYITFHMNKKFFFAILAVSAVLAVIAFNMISSVMDINKAMRYFERFSLERAERDGGSGRLQAWMDYYTYAEPKHFISGVGTMSTTSVIIYDKFPRLSRSAIDHPSSTYIYMLFTYGIPGLMCYMGFVFKMLAELFRHKRANRNGRIEIINIGIALSNCVWGLTSYSPMLGITISMFHIYAISQALMKPSHKNNPLPL